MITSDVREDPWLTGVLHRPVVAVDARDDVDVEALRHHAAEHPGALYYAKVPTANVPVVQALVDLGFVPVDVAITLVRGTEPAQVRSPGGVVLTPAAPEHHDAVVDVAGAAFRWTRFHLDPGIADADADRIKREWVRNCLAGMRGIGVQVALVDGVVAGFLATLAARWQERESRVIDLVAVHPEHQGRGVGGALVDAFIREHGPAAEVLVVGTQAANIGSLALYESRGFRVAQTQYVLHLHTAA